MERPAPRGHVADRLGRVAVGHDAVDDGSVELVQISELVERRGNLGVGRLGHLTCSEHDRQPGADRARAAGLLRLGLLLGLLALGQRRRRLVELDRLGRPVVRMLFQVGVP